MSGFGPKQAREVSAEYKRVAKAANAMYNIGSEEENVRAYMKDLPIRKEIRSDPARLIINQEKQARHIKGSDGYTPGRSYVTVSNDELQDIVEKYAGTGEIQRSARGVFMWKEIVTLDNPIGVSINPETLEEIPTNRIYIHYSKTGSHVVPTARGMKK